MPKSTISKSGEHAQNLWKEAYKALCDDDQGRDRLHKLNKRLRVQLGKPKLNLRSEDGYKELLGLINTKSQKLLSNKKSSSKMAIVCDNMLRIKDLVAMGASVGGPYVAIPAAALFLVFSMEEMYRSEKDAMFRLAERVAHYTVLTAKSHDRIKAAPGDDEDMQELKSSLRIVVVGLYKMILFASAELANFLYSDWKLAKTLMGTYDWKDQLESLIEQFDWCVHYRDEMDSRQKSPSTAPRRDLKRAMGPGCRNPLHWAVELVVPDRVGELVSSKEFPINALTPRSWTAAHLAARHGNTKIMKMLLTADGINLKIQNEEGHTPLHIAALHNRIGAVKLICQRNARLLQIRNKKGHTAFLLAAQKGFVKVLEALSDYGQDSNEVTLTNGWTGLHIAAENGRIEVVKFLLAHDTRKEAKTTGGAWKGCTAKQVAERKGKVEVAKLL